MVEWSWIKKNKDDESGRTYIEVKIGVGKTERHFIVNCNGSVSNCSEAFAIAQSSCFLYVITSFCNSFFSITLLSVSNVTNSKKKRLSSPGVLTERELPWFEFFFIQK